MASAAAPPGSGACRPGDLGPILQEQGLLLTFLILKEESGAALPLQPNLPETPHPRKKGSLSLEPAQSLSPSGAQRSELVPALWPSGTPPTSICQHLREVRQHSHNAHRNLRS